MKITAERHDKNCYRLKDETGTIVGFALRMTNDKWRLFDIDEKPLSKVSFDTVAQVRDSMQRRVGVDGIPRTPIEIARVRELLDTENGEEETP